jgi:hypothetical protein
MPAVAIAAIVLIVAAYPVPSIIGYARAVPEMRAVLSVNLLYGWTITGWLRALQMSLRPAPEPLRHPALAPAPASAQARLTGPRPGTPPPLQLARRGDGRRSG